MKIVSLMCFCALLAACSDSGSPSKPEPLAKSQIAWYDGTVEAAFLEAAEHQKPLFLYWGAVWCPPCQEIKHTVFKSRRFITHTEAFVPVYLDGDTREAQVIGEKFGVKGYPTMIVFNQNGVEITRLPGGIDISRYNDILELSLNSITATADLVQRVVSAPETVSEQHLKQLAYYSWGQDFSALPDDYSPDLFLTMSELATDEVSNTRLYMQYLYEVAQAYENADSDAPPVIAGAEARLNQILDSDALVLANWDSLAYSATELLPHISPDSQKLALKWQARLKAMSSDPSLSVAEQLAGILPSLELYFLDDEDKLLDPELKTWVLAATAAADVKTKNSFARQSVVNQINYVLQTAGLIAEAKALLLKELERSPSPYYFMSSLASIAEREQDFTLALDWRQKAYANSTGSATRFQWGANYVKAIIRLQPDNESLIQTTSMSLLDELQISSDVFAGRNFRVLRSLNKQLIAWQADRAQTLLADFRTSLDRRCQELKTGSQEATNCASLTET